MAGRTESDELRALLDLYRGELREVAPDLCRRLDGKMFEAGLGWVSEDDRQLDMDRIVSAREIFNEYGVPAWKVRDWSRRHPDLIPKLKKDGRVLFRLGDVIGFWWNHKKKNQHG
jgi:hypothetical protein